MAYAAGLKPAGPQGPYGFKSRPGYAAFEYFPLFLPQYVFVCE